MLTNDFYYIDTIVTIWFSTESTWWGTKAFPLESLQGPRREITLESPEICLLKLASLPKAIITIVQCYLRRN